MRKLLLLLVGLIMSIAPTFATSITYSGSFQDCVDQDEIEMNANLVVPGDAYQETLHFKNVMKKELKVYLVLENESNELYDLTIDQDGKELITVNAGEMTEGEEVFLGTFGEDEECDLDFTLKVPESLNNDYTLQGESAKWKLVVEEKTKSPKTGIYTNSLYLLGAVGALFIAVIGGRKRHE